MCVCVRVRVCTCVHTGMCVQVHGCMGVHVHMYMHVHVSMCVLVYTCSCGYGCVCVCNVHVCLCVYIKDTYIIYSIVNAGTIGILYRNHFHLNGLKQSALNQVLIANRESFTESGLTTMPLKMNAKSTIL